MSTVAKPIRALIFALTLAAIGCQAQTPTETSGKLSPETVRRVEVLIRSRSNVPANYEIQVGPRTKSEVPGLR